MRLNEYGSVFALAAKTGQHVLMTVLLVTIPIATCWTEWALQEACTHGQVNAVILLLATVTSIAPSYDKNLATRLAISRGHHDIVRLLMADPRVQPCKYVVEAALRARDVGTIRLLVKDGRAPLSGETLCRAVRQNNAAMARVLLTDPRVVVVGYNLAHKATARVAKPQQRSLWFAMPQVNDA